MDTLPEEEVNVCRVDRKNDRKSDLQQPAKVVGLMKSAEGLHFD
jgi:hypothetical protein